MCKYIEGTIEDNKQIIALITAMDDRRNCKITAEQKEVMSKYGITRDRECNLCVGRIKIYDSYYHRVPRMEHRHSHGENRNYWRKTKQINYCDMALKMVARQSNVPTVWAYKLNYGKPSKYNAQMGGCLDDSSSKFFALSRLLKAKHSAIENIEEAKAFYLRRCEELFNSYTRDVDYNRREIVYAEEDIANYMNKLRGLQ